MRKIYLFMMISADGFFEGPDHDLSWHNAQGQEFEDFANKQLDEADTLVFGARTYAMMEDFWAGEQGKELEPETAKRMNAKDKIVFSKTLQAATWEHTQLFHDNPAQVLNDLKAKPGKEIAVLGSSNLCLTLLKEGVLDELRLMVFNVGIND